jgi:uncharacterized Rossmann fold enzyme
VYRRILADFGFSESSDMESAMLLSTLAGSKSAPALEAVMSSAVPGSALVCGGSDRLSRQIEDVALEGWVVAADGATSTLLSHGILPDIIVTDLDGDVEDQVRANLEGSVVFVHAHGDNMQAVSEHVPKFNERVVCTCQCPPVSGVHNFGGFTDGDRAVCIVSTIGARTIRLVGFDFDNPSAKAGRSLEVKSRKLQWARRILAMLAQEGVRLEPPIVDG